MAYVRIVSRGYAFCVSLCACVMWPSNWFPQTSAGINTVLSKSQLSVVTGLLCNSNWDHWALTVISHGTVESYEARLFKRSNDLKKKKNRNCADWADYLLYNRRKVLPRTHSGCLNNIKYIILCVLYYLLGYSSAMGLCNVGVFCCG